ncbi:ATP-binding protein [Acetobacterium bakii]|uniref:Biotin carboxylase n=1 Tax=Acetobacterium bakii TaxID=52689 RepID=A0A0L6U352_9FIRM|nr:ATP-binding protein [Acetobacterium bakii]KNZ42934.1 biotin carboxylase [Acetobacterium bakii]
MAMVPKRIATTIMNALKGGVVPRVGLPYIAVGREIEIKALLHDIDIIEDGGASFRFIVGKYGSGKSFLLQTMRSYVMDKNFVVVDADLSPERRLVGTKGQGIATYKELMKNMSTKTRPDGGALPLILEKWISGIQTNVVTESKITAEDSGFNGLVETKIYEVMNELEGMVHGFDFAKMISMYYKAYTQGDDETKAKVLRWFRGEYATKTEAKRDLGVNIIIKDDDWYEYIKIFALFLVRAGYGGMLILIDELVNIYKVPNAITRQYNYEKILMMYNDTLQGKAKHIGIIMGGTPQCIEDTRRGVFSYEALKSRLAEGRFATEDTRDMLAPIIRLAPLSHEEMYILIEKLADIHAGLFSYESTIEEEDMINFIKIEYSRIGASSNITPREIIRDFIELLNIIYQNPEKKISDIMQMETFEFAKTELNEEELLKEYEEFEI